jgi:hypothetical protein
MSHMWGEIEVVQPSREPLRIGPVHVIRDTGQRVPSHAF